MSILKYPDNISPTRVFIKEESGPDSRRSSELTFSSITFPQIEYLWAVALIMLTFKCQ